MKQSGREGRNISSWIRAGFWFAGIGFGLAETIASRFSLNVDGVSYLDLGHALWTREWNAAVNGYWSPLYAWLIGGVLYRSCFGVLGIDGSARCKFHNLSRVDGGV